MSAGTDSQRDPRPAEERAEEMMERLFADGSRILGKVAGRVREEVEDIVAEARTLHEKRSREAGRE
jgi:hypothetical protein